jgi:NAD(P)-dependent dehydrogenase (short-subunit alcohol dehydrogenase family)
MTAAVPANYQPREDLLAGRVILVTGAGQGLGREVALAAAACGARTVLLGRKAEKLEATADAIEAAGGQQPGLAPLDLATAGDAEFESLSQLIRRDFRRLDGIAHCASHFVPLGPLANQTLDQWLQLIRVNLAAPFALTRACLGLLAANDSSVVFVGETHGQQPAAYWGGFAVAKSALPALATIWSQELEQKATPRMNVFVPGPIASPQRARSHPAENRPALRSPESAARALVYLLGPESVPLSGQTLVL